MAPLVLPLPGNEALARGLANAGGFELGALETRRFPDGETYLRVLTPPAGRPAVLVCTLADPDPKIAPLLLAAGAARDLGASRVGLVAPYLPYMRQDRAFRPGEAVSARHFAAALSRAVDWLVTVDPHLHRIPRLSEVYDIPAEALHAAPLFADWIAAAVPAPLLIGPDEESRQWVSALAGALDAPFAVARKTRAGDRDVRIVLPDLAQWRGRNPVIVDDVAASGHTLLELVRLLRAAGLPPPACAVVHGLFAGDSYARLRAECAAVATANTIPHDSNAVDVSALIAAAVSRLA